MPCIHALIIKKKITKIDLQCLLMSLPVSVFEHLAKDISHKAIYWSSETFPFQLKGFVIHRLWHMCKCVCMCV